MLHFRVHSKFFYSRLNNYEKEIYDKILGGWLDYQESITISIFNNGKINLQNILDCVYDDNPELFYVDRSKIYVISTPVSVTVSAKMIYSKVLCEQIKKEIGHIILTLEQLCTPETDKEKIVHDYLINSVSYSLNLYSPDAHSIKGALIDGYAVCEGYARAFKLLCDAVKIPCIVISGIATNSQGTTERHTWNIIRKNKNNYHVDVTWNYGMRINRSSNVSGGFLYYNVPDDYISKDHTWDNCIWPNCRDSSEIDEKIPLVTGKRNLRELLMNATNNKVPVLALRFNRKFASTDDVINIVNQTIRSSLIAIASFSLVYHSVLDSAIIQIDYY